MKLHSLSTLILLISGHLLATQLEHMPSSPQNIDVAIQAVVDETTEYDAYHLISYISGYLRGRIVTNDLNEIQRLLEKGLDINFQDHCGFTLLMHAVVRKNKSLVDYLLAYPGINIDLKNSLGQTAKEMAGPDPLGLFK